MMAILASTRRRLKFIRSLVLVLGATSGSALAGPVTATYFGTISGFSDTYNYFGGGTISGTEVFGFSFDPANCTDSGGGSSDRLGGAGCQLTVFVTLNGVTVSATATSNPPNLDSQPWDSGRGSLYQYQTLGANGILLNLTTGVPWVSGSLQSGPPAASDLNTSPYFEGIALCADLDSVNCEYPNPDRGSIVSSISTTPEPGSMPLVMIGTGAAVWTRRRWSSLGVGKRQIAQ